MVEFIIGAFLYAKLKHKYRILPVIKHWTMWLPLGFMFFYIFLEITMWMEWYYFLPYAHLIKTATLLSYIPLIIEYKLYLNKDGNTYPSPMILATFCLWLGSELNKIAMKANNGFMPCFPSNSYWTRYSKPNFVQDGVHILGNAYSHLIPICNTIDVFYSIWSPGDILIRLFAFIIIYHSIKRSNKK